MHEREWNISFKNMTKKPESICRMALGPYGNNVLCGTYHTIICIIMALLERILGKLTIYVYSR